MLAVAAALVLAGCGGDSAEEATTPVKVYFLGDGHVRPVARAVDEDGDLTDAALTVLVAGPSAEERMLGLTTAIPDTATVSRDDSCELTVEDVLEPFDIALGPLSIRSRSSPAWTSRTKGRS